jgi:molybdopterin converting factor subunit 1
MKVEVKLFAGARQRVGAPSVEIELPDNARVLELREAIAARYPALAGAMGLMRFAVDNEYASDESPISPAAEVACIPPVSGG